MGQKAHESLYQQFGAKDDEAIGKEAQRRPDTYYSGGQKEKRDGVKNFGKEWNSDDEKAFEDQFSGLKDEENGQKEEKGEHFGDELNSEDEETFDKFNSFNSNYFDA